MNFYGFCNYEEVFGEAVEEVMVYSMHPLASNRFSCFLQKDFESGLPIKEAVFAINRLNHLKSRFPDHAHAIDNLQLTIQNFVEEKNLLNVALHARSDAPIEFNADPSTNFPLVASKPTRKT